MDNVYQAADVVWRLVSTIDAIRLQQVSYAVVAPSLEQEAAKLSQLHHAIQESHEGLALVMLAGTGSAVLPEVKDDLRALTQAMKGLGQVHERRPVRYRCF